MFAKDNGAVHGLRLVVPLLMAIIAILYATATVSGHQLPPGNHKLCGPALSDAMDVVCAHGYNSLPQKRGVLPSEELPDNALWPGLAGAAGYSFSPLLTNLYGIQILVKTPRHRRHLPGGVYDECCVKSCSYEDLAAYCLPK
ncbi:probable insulin-like peptide 1 [Drosophila ficusphila]|uniref:probable insulin-like peptide 1 n=1 Tax=Drosophila ficusphila TaxID=30025 RepID=UPI0007E84A5A|nr:probable insulin-like peptide 1 [Drosophila ficusphila]